MTDVVNQHYVPQMLLKNFCNQNSGKIFVFDKETGRSFETNVRNAAAQREYYNFSHEGTEFSMEETLSRAESAVKPLFDAIIENRSLSVLTEDNCVSIALFTSVQHLRGPRVRKDQEIIANSLRERFGDTPEGLALLDKEWPSGKDHAKNFAIYFLGKEAPKFANHFLKKTWYLLETTKENPFNLSDTPVVLFNDNDFGPYGNLGLNSRGIQITFPISTELALGFYCPSIESEFRKGIENFNKLKISEPDIKIQYGKAIETAKEFISAAETGSPIKLTNDNVLHLNSLQVSRSSRFIFSSHNDFSLAQDMVAKGHANGGNIQCN